MNLGLEGKVVLVTGASRGIGAATARLLKAEGALLALSARQPESLDAMAKELDAFAIPADLTVSADADRAVAATVEKFGRIDVLVVCAGAAKGGLFWEIDDATWQTSFDLKFFGMVRLLRAAAPVMAKQGFGSIVVVVGNNGRQAHPRMLPGSAANAACLAVVKGLAEELAPSGVRVNAVNPGPTRTSRWTNMIADMARASGRSEAEVDAEQLSRIPNGKITEPEEVARMVAMMASDTMASLNGAAITIDGGATKTF